MRVLVVTPWYPNDATPYAGAFVERDVRMLRGGHQVTVAHLVAPAHSDGGPTVVERNGVRVVRIPMAPSDPRQWWRAGRRLRSLLNDADALNSHAATSLWPVALAGVGRTPWVHTEHSSAIGASFGGGAAARRTRAIRRALLNRPGVVIAVSDHLGELIRRLGRRGPIMTVPNAVDAPTPVPPKRSGDGRLRLVAVGGLTEGKRPLLAVRMLAELHSRGRDAHLTWVGGGPLLAEAVTLATDLGVDDRVDFVGAQRPDEVGAHLIASDVFVLPTEGETFGVAIAEAIAHGRPVVVGATGGHVEFVAPSIGELVAEANPEAYADAVAVVFERTRGLSAEDIAATLGLRFHDSERLGAYDRAFARAAGRG
ncbi:glycosyltransferase involved in cell wall biosynthesis [Agromyces cerinus]|uniref:glycosyltransferase n=1 Tax=Agromyces cerinus TaxID=33878 RepID=UPI00195B93CC|nr:glycosyltransferase [Agromyces cerinus]MBM7830027.1 glycosyltransferase involved in cell wall biosynthesis [Agromyces cerinus]